MIGDGLNYWVINYISLKVKGRFLVVLESIERRNTLITMVVTRNPSPGKEFSIVKRGVVSYGT